MKKIELNAPLQDWMAYLNEKYQWDDDIGMMVDDITPALIELVLHMDGYIKHKEQDQ